MTTNPQTDMNPSQQLPYNLGQAWDLAIREFLVETLHLPASFDERDHASFIIENGQFMIHHNGARDFSWCGVPVLRGQLVKNNRDIRYKITKLKT